MEFVEGANLRTVLRASRIDERPALNIATEICSALQYAHEFGVVHRDIKPENVLIDARGHVKIADFGLAKLIRPEVDVMGLTTSHQVMGTPQYMAPEQIEQPSAVDFRADLYALGVVLYELLTGELPLGRFDVPSQKVAVDSRLDAIVMKALEKDRERRYQKASDIQTDIAAVFKDAPSEPKPAPEVSPVLRGAGAFRVLLEDVGAQRDDIVRALSEVWQCSQREARRQLTPGPVEVAVGADFAQAQWIRARLEAFGGEVVPELLA